eukprot:81489-Rhodomonas_salina.1
MQVPTPKKPDAEPLDPEPSRAWNVWQEVGAVAERARRDWQPWQPSPRPHRGLLRPKPPRFPSFFPPPNSLFSLGTPSETPSFPPVDTSLVLRASLLFLSFFFTACILSLSLSQYLLRVLSISFAFS